MNTLVRYVNRGLAIFTISLSSFLVFCVIWQVLSRYVVGQPSTVTDELSRYLFMWVALIGAAYTTGQQRHLAIDLLSMKLTGRRKLVLALVIQFAIALFSIVVLIYGGGNLALKTIASHQVTPALGIQMGYVYFCLPVSGLLMVFYSVVFSVEHIRQMVKGHAAAAIEPNS